MTPSQQDARMRTSTLNAGRHITYRDVVCGRVLKVNLANLVRDRLAPLDARVSERQRETQVNTIRLSKRLMAIKGVAAGYIASAC
jgi:hypothetical protein